MWKSRFWLGRKYVLIIIDGDDIIDGESNSFWYWRAASVRVAVVSNGR